MSLAMVFLLGSFVLTCLVSIYYFLTANDKPVSKDNGEVSELVNMLHGWKISIVIFLVVCMLFLIYYTSLLTLLTPETSFTDNEGWEVTQVSSQQDYLIGWEFLKIMMALVYIDFGLMVWRVMNQTGLMIMFFGKRYKSGN